MTQLQFDYTRPAARGDGPACTAQAWARVPQPLSAAERQRLKARAAELLARRQAVLVAHYYVDGDLQDLALDTGGCVAD